MSWSPALVLGVMCIVVSLLDPLYDAFVFDRDAIGRGQLWRLVGAHLAHSDATHLFLNMAGLVVAWLLVGDQWRPLAWVSLMVAIAVLTGMGLWFLVPALTGYTGASGLLHGVLAAGAVGMWRSWRTGSVLLLVFLAAKAAFESWVGPVVYPADTIVEAHLIGSASGILLAAPLLKPGQRV